MLTDDYLDLTDDPRAKVLAAKTCTIETFLLRVLGGEGTSVRFSGLSKEILLHGHCHQKALWGASDALGLLNMPPRYSATLIDSACCGMAGSFGYETEHYDVSLKVGEDRLLSAVRRAPPEVEIATAGVSCRQQILHATGRHARHPVELLWEAVADGGDEGG
jgi:Fe-S oxidoreductase